MSDLSSSWQAYEERKEKAKQDPSIFCPEVLWEFDYLLDSIVNTAPQVDPLTVTLAIRENMRNTIAPRLRSYFVELVVESIKARENRWQQIIKQTQQDAA